MHPSSLSSFVDQLQEGGRYVFTLKEARKLGGRSESGLKIALGRLKKQGRIVSPRQGFFVIVPLEYRRAGAPPASWFIDDLMRYMRQPYYVGLLSAAAIHGAAHQQPMVFQVVTDRPTRASRAARIRIEFHMHGQVKSLPVGEVQTETGTMRVATPEVTAFDLVRYSEAAGHMGNVVTILAELSEKLDPRALAKVAPHYATPDVQRLGYLLEAIGHQDIALPLKESLPKRKPRPVPLVTGRSTKGLKADPGWKVLPNHELESDL
ncbi:MAG: type IV toxin-antitoxin system AbiEi family antitoxin [Bdellovibrionota bacterium]